ncbi:TIGR04255 family protein [Dehalogenimonas alkenigignens]|uniref:TIGR04255 family protein n=1 Tax=Dehalogenimonas alkenigignens TaxID=1217799 RepID=UPI000D571B01|nr:TIGR04255 family protein [Dehalogenimonas alkenigignens]PVV83533.1 hypothetical protein DD509_06800 [Dehalogenimonas alkenigignens]
MLFPESERVLYQKNPLSEVICQVQFPAILKITSEENIAVFQEIIRADYPFYVPKQPELESSLTLPIELKTVMEQFFPKVPGSIVYQFSDKTKTRTIVLSKDFLALTFRAYSRWEAFLAEFNKAEKALRDVFKPSVYTRLGLRYKDMITRTKLGLGSTSWSELIQGPILGLLGDRNVEPYIDKSVNKVTIKIPDIPGATIQLTSGTANVLEGGEQVFYIDADFSIKDLEEFNAVGNYLSQFNTIAGRLFRASIRPKLHSAMEPTSI